MFSDDRSTPGSRRVRAAIAAIDSGSPVVVIDDIHRARLGALAFAAEHATPELLSFVVRYSCGFVCTALPARDCVRLELPLIAAGTTDQELADHCVTVDLRGTGTGISATARARTIAALSCSNSEPEDFSRPGHVVPMRTRPGGVLDRPGQAEAAVDLAQLAGRRHAGAFAGLVSDTRPEDTPSVPELVRFAAKHSLAVVSLTDLTQYRSLCVPALLRGKETTLRTARGPMRAIEFHSANDDVEVLALVAGEISSQHDMLMRVHHACLAGTVLGAAAECRCGLALAESTQELAAAGRGVVLRLRNRHEARSCGGFSAVTDGITGGVLHALGVESAPPQLLTRQLVSADTAGRYGSTQPTERIQ